MKTNKNHYLIETIANLYPINVNSAIKLFDIFNSYDLLIHHIEKCFKLGLDINDYSSIFQKSSSDNESDIKPPIGINNNNFMGKPSEGNPANSETANCAIFDVSAMLPDEKDEKYQQDRNEICFRAYLNMQQHLVRKNVENGFDLGVRYIKTLLGNLR